MNTDPIFTDTLVIGGGPAGLAAAYTLEKNKQDFLLFTDRLGGRLFHSEDGKMNFGATYLNDDYTTLLQFAKRGRRLRIREVYATNTGVQLRALDPFATSSMSA